MNSLGVYEWNGWTIHQPFDAGWYVARKPGKDSFWFHATEIPGSVARGEHGQSDHLLYGFLNALLPNKGAS